MSTFSSNGSVRRMAGRLSRYISLLPFEDNFFDAAHCHTVLIYVPDTQAALTEIKRSLPRSRLHQYSGFHFLGLFQRAPRD